jgi:hypothetical protein
VRNVKQATERDGGAICHRDRRHLNCAGSALEEIYRNEDREGVLVALRVTGDVTKLGDWRRKIHFYSGDNPVPIGRFGYKVVDMLA